ncbi:MAG: PRC-barrel domain-containing protein [Elusimicrobiota bacterium]|jgi:16S rRNA processing protein RimM|nr:PRC-barrel domain-containing protein [Elusimicrobiota bacterium]
MEYNNSSSGSWKISGILGFEVYNLSGEYLGVLYDVVITGSNDVWVVRSSYEEILIPALKNIIKEVNMVRKKIFVSLPKEFEMIYGSIQSADGNERSDYIIYED